MAREVQQQLPLSNDASLQGDLFGGAPAPATAAPEQEAEGGLDDQTLLADASARPRTRRRPSVPKPAEPERDRDPREAAQGESPDPDADLPRWHHHSLVDPAALTPVLRHYVELKAAHPDRVLLYRLGDFFEFFFEDAILLSRLLELTLTGKDAGKVLGRVPMAGIPHHAAERYCADLVRRGLSVALCDQLEATPAKGALLRRGITRVLTPGTVLEEGMLAARRNNWLCAVVLDGDGSHAGRWGLAVADVSTGDFRVTERGGSGSLHQELLQLEPAEVVWPGQGDTPAWCPEGLRLTPLARTPFETTEAAALLRRRFRLASLDGLG
ncbi:DNA mismatch repair protein MutS, partial [Synechococcus sp. BA-132 BA5]|nr:DNA mismatch repair protein MutS [Synechococcus sp. BA-132 BA5]